MAEYMERMALQLEVFGGDIEFEGITASDTPSMIIGEPAGQPSVVISQGWIEAEDPQNPNPSIRQIAEFMQSYGFCEAEGSFFGWIRDDGIAVVDAKPDNFILTGEGVVPIDLQMARLEGW